MRTVRLKSGGHVNVFSPGEAAIPGEVNFSEREWAMATKLGKNAADPEAQKEFWRAVIEKKLMSQTYSIFDDFPEVEGSGLPSGPAPVSPSASNAPSQHNRVRDFPGAAICASVIEQLKGLKREDSA